MKIFLSTLFDSNCTSLVTSDVRGMNRPTTSLRTAVSISNIAILTHGISVFSGTSISLHRLGIGTFPFSQQLSCKRSELQTTNLLQV